MTITGSMYAVVIIALERERAILHPLKVRTRSSEINHCIFVYSYSYLSVFSSFCLSVFLSFCLFVFLSFCLLRSSQVDSDQFQGRSHKEKLLFFWIWMSKLPFPPSPQFGQLVQLFSDVKIQDLKVSLELKIKYVLYNILYIYNLKNSLKFRLLAFWRKLTPFIDQKCFYEKVQNFLAKALHPSPPHLDKIQKNSSFSSGYLP